MNNKNLSHKRIVVDTLQDFIKLKQIIKMIKKPFTTNLEQIINIMKNEKI